MALQPLLRQTRLLPGESLPSLIARLEQLNAYPSGWLRELCEGEAPGWPGRAFELPATAAAWRRLAHLSGISGARLYQASPVSFARAWLTAEAGARDIGPQLRRREALLRATAEQPKFCPACLRGGLYHRLCWWPGWSYTCTRHARWLVSECPGCRRPVTYRAICAGRCGRCQLDFTQVDLPRIPRQSFTYFVQAVLHFWLGLGPRPTQRWLDTLPRGTKAQRMRWFWQLNRFYRVYGFEALRRSLCQEIHGPAWWQMEDPVVEQAAGYVVVMRHLVDWPTGMYEFLDVFTPYENWELFPGTDTSQDWRERLEKNFPPVRRAAQEYQTQPPALRLATRAWRPFTWLTLGAVARQLQLPEIVLKRFMEWGHLPARTIDLRHRRRCSLIHREQVTQLAKLIRQPLPTAEAASWLGLPLPTVQELIQQHCLRERRRGQLSWHSVIQFFASVAQRATDQKSAAICLLAALPIVATVGISVPQLLGWVAAGRLACHWQGDGSLALRNLAFTQLALEEMRAAYCVECGILTAEEVMKSLGVNRQTLGRLASAGLLVARGAGGQLYEAQAVEQLARQPHDWQPLRELISTRDLSIRLGMRLEDIYRAIRAGSIRPASGPAIDSAQHYQYEAPDDQGWPYRKPFWE